MMIVMHILRHPPQIIFLYVTVDDQYRECYRDKNWLMISSGFVLTSNRTFAGHQKDGALWAQMIV